jgi:hypothetical protein
MRFSQAIEQFANDRSLLKFSLVTVLGQRLSRQCFNQFDRWLSQYNGR